MDKDHTSDDQVGLASVNAADVLTAGKITEGWYFYFALLLLLLFLLPTSTSTSTSHFPFYFYTFFKVGMI